MASVYLTSTNRAAIAGDWWTNFLRLRKSALACSDRIHDLVEVPDDADIILFSDSVSDVQSDVRRHDLARQFSDKVFVYSTRDRDLPLIPGVYTSAKKRWYYPAQMRSGFYIKVIDHDWIQASPIDNEARHLFSFWGAFDNHPVRRRLGKLINKRGNVKDTSGDQGRRVGQDADTYKRWQTDYFQSIRESMFVLCPRGAVPSSYRIFEAMKAGRVPVIIADAWVPPVGPTWSEFSVQVPEALLEEAPNMLERITSRAPEMGLRAREAWERWFSTEQAFHTVVTWCLQIKGARSKQGPLRRYRPLLELGRPAVFWDVLLPAAKRRVRAQLGRRRRSDLNHPGSE